MDTKPVGVNWPTRAPTGLWSDRAACRGMDPNIFFPSTVDEEKRAISICMECQVRSDCLDHAIEQDEGDGVWGATTVKEREKIVDKRKAAERSKERKRISNARSAKSARERSKA